VNAILLLMGLLVLSYIGSFLVGGRVLRGFGLPSGAEYVVLGFLLGPFVLGLLDRSTVHAFEPLADVALGWLALLVGLDFGFVGNRRVRPGRLGLGVGLALAAGGAVAFAIWLAAHQLAPGLSPRDRALLALGVGAVCAETTRHAILWVVQRHRASGPLSSLIADLADSDDLAPLLMMGVAFSLDPTAATPWPIAFYGWTLMTLAIGVTLGLIAVVLLGSDFRLIQSWGVLLGTSLLTIGIAARVGLSPLLATFTMGVTIAAASRHRDEIVAMVAPTERPVLLPALLLAGAHVNPKAAPFLLPIAGVALAVRVIAKLGAGLVIRAAFPEARGTGRALGLGLLSSGAVAMSVGLAFALRFPGQVGDTILVVATAATIFGEFAGPAALSAGLRQAGEITEPVSDPSAAPAEPPPAGDDEPGRSDPPAPQADLEEARQ
jgi:Kef-type K+ transport system membrane component KefB